MQAFKTVFLFFAAGLFVYLINTPAELKSSKYFGESDPVKDFSLKTLDGETVGLSEFKGKILILNFWATWCPPCRKEIPDLIAVQKAYKDKGVVILGVAVDEELDDVRSFVRKYEINYMVALDDGSIFSQWEGEGIPLTFFIDRRGRIKNRSEGMLTRQEIDEILQQLLAEE
ncbi:MAG: TlpA disulfide reductase family protein [Acidobacteriota bacterium]|nr:TlpA family protein disulfide reductase [Blastocatellia bacterium]MDW8412585.1 TlpA disulfide reductase family protein [Acidobacteriota bacterium]